MVIKWKKCNELGHCLNQEYWIFSYLQFLLRIKIYYSYRWDFENLIFSHHLKISFLTGFCFVLCFFAYFLFCLWDSKSEFKKREEVVNIYYITTMCLASWMYISSLKYSLWGIGNLNPFYKWGDKVYRLNNLTNVKLIKDRVGKRKQNELYLL